MRWMLYCAVCVACSGCATVAGNVPSFQYCDKVHYERVGNLVKITAECQLPIGGGLPATPGL